MHTQTCEVFGQVWVVHEAVASKLDTLQTNRDMDVIEPAEEYVEACQNHIHIRS